MKTYKCIGCGVDAVFGYSKLNKFCSNICQGNYKWINETVPRIERGECSGPPPLRKYLTEKYGDICSSCGVGSTWNNKPLTLHVDHIDGNSDNNFIDNLRLLCPNCHSQTDTFGSKGMGSRYRKTSRRAVYNQNYRDYGSLV